MPLISAIFPPGLSDFLNEWDDLTVIFLFHNFWTVDKRVSTTIFNPPLAQGLRKFPYPDWKGVVYYNVIKLSCT